MRVIDDDALAMQFIKLWASSDERDYSEKELLADLQTEHLQVQKKLEDELFDVVARHETKLNKEQEKKL